MIGLKHAFFEKAADRMPEGMRPSPFTDRTDWVGQGPLTFLVSNGFPSTRGHALILPRDFATYRLTDLARDELKEHIRMLHRVKDAFNQHFKPDGYNIGWNVGFDGGQSIAHAHMHIMPRYDAVNRAHHINPRGGIARLPLKEQPAFYGRRHKGDLHRLEKTLLQSMPVLTRNDHAYAVPVPRDIAMTPGHTLILTRRGLSSVFDLSAEEGVAQLDLALQVMNMQSCSTTPPDGYNLGWDVGAAAGQLLSQTYLHVVPRYRGDIETPRGGIVRIIPEAAWPDATDYYDKKNVGRDVALTKKIVFPFNFWDGPDRQNVMCLG